MKITVVKDYRGQEEIHKAGCADLKKSKNRPYRLAEALTMDVDTLEDLYRVYWECIDDEAVAAGDYPTVEHAWYAWTGEFDVKPCAASVPDMPEPGSAPVITPREAKADLAKRLLLAAEAMLASADGSEAFLSAMSEDEARETIDFWLRRTLPRGVFES